MVIAFKKPTDTVCLWLATLLNTANMFRHYQMAALSGRLPRLNVKSAPGGMYVYVKSVWESVSYLWQVLCIIRLQGL